MKILSIETSCDETAAAVVERLPSSNLKIISNITASSAGIHARTGGVIPEDAARKQIESIIPVIKLALSESKLSNNDIDAIAVTVGPGLIGSLLAGVETAKTLSFLWNKPIIPVNHLLGHVYANWLNQEKHSEFPALSLVVSGGHTDLILMHSYDEVEYVGGTRDDAAGEAFDKTARLLGLPYPGGPNISKFAQKYLDKNPNEKLTLFPRPMIGDNTFDWSFSGLKTAVLREVSSKNSKLSDYKSIAKNKGVVKNKEKLSAEIQEAIIDSLVEKSLRAIEKYKPKSFLLAGGVSANSRLREKFQSRIPLLRDSGKLAPIAFHVPEVNLCTDNAAAIAATAFFVGKEIPWQNIVANPELTIVDK